MANYLCQFKLLMHRLIIPRGMASRLFAIICLIDFFLTASLSLVVSSVSGRMLCDEARQRLDSQPQQTVNVFDQYMDILRQTVLAASR